IAQEALNNTLKHATATSVIVYLRVNDEWVELEIADNGQGFDTAATGKQGGIGLVSMRERAERLGGVLMISSTLGEGTRVSVKLSRNL
ncbi:MAG: sensor histidine kinase, partial [Oceanicoccus sp.]|uniref:ATP-binding protein n=1 Tax=Oceanicoccus sp. TaxID=2691044 RepID=UPI0026135B72